MGLKGWVDDTFQGVIMTWDELCDLAHCFWVYSDGRVEITWYKENG